MKILYDPKADILRILFSNAPINGRKPGGVVYLLTNPHTNEGTMRRLTGLNAPGSWGIPWLLGPTV